MILKTTYNRVLYCKSLTKALLDDHAFVRQSHSEHRKITIPMITIKFKKKKFDKQGTLTEVIAMIQRYERKYERNYSGTGG